MKLAINMSRKMKEIGNIITFVKKKKTIKLYINSDMKINSNKIFLHENSND